MGCPWSWGMLRKGSWQPRHSLGVRWATHSEDVVTGCPAGLDVRGQFLLCSSSSMA